MADDSPDPYGYAPDVPGQEPRIAPLPVEALGEDLMRMVASMAGVNQALNARGKGVLAELLDDEISQERRAEIIEILPQILRTMVRHADLFSRLTDVGLELLANGAIPVRERELMVLRIGWLCQAPFEFGEHVILAKAAGITSEEIERITQGSSAPGWSEQDRALMRAVEELHARAMISDETWAMLAKTYDEKQLIELPIIVGQYQLVAYYQNSLRLRLHQGNLGLAAR